MLISQPAPVARRRTQQESDQADPPLTSSAPLRPNKLAYFIQHGRNAVFQARQIFHKGLASESTRSRIYPCSAFSVTTSTSRPRSCCKSINNPPRSKRLRSGSQLDQKIDITIRLEIPRARRSQIRARWWPRDERRPAISLPVCFLAAVQFPCRLVFLKRKTAFRIIIPSVGRSPRGPTGAVRQVMRGGVVWAAMKRTQTCQVRSKPDRSCMTGYW